MSIYVGNSILTRIFCGNRPVRSVIAAHSEGAPGKVVFNTAPFNVIVDLQQKNLDFITDVTMTVSNYSVYDETLHFFAGRAGWKSEHANELNSPVDLGVDGYNQAAIDTLRNAGVLSEFTIQAGSNKKFNYTLSADQSSYNFSAAFRLFRKNDDGALRLLFYTGSLADDYERYLIKTSGWNSTATYTYSIT